MTREKKILVAGAFEGLGPGLTTALRSTYGYTRVITAGRDFRHCPQGLYRQLDMTDKRMLADLVRKESITRIYLLDDYSNAEADRGIIALLNVLNTAVELSVASVFWPSSFEVSGSYQSGHLCPQEITGRPHTANGIRKLNGEYWCNHFHDAHGLDVRSIRFPALISPAAQGFENLGGYVVEMIRHALDEKAYSCFLEEDTCLPMIYLPDAVQAVMQLMDVPANRVSIRTAYNLAAMSFAPCDLAAGIRKHLPGLMVSYAPDIRQAVAHKLPAGTNDDAARRDWSWKPRYDLDKTIADIRQQLTNHRMLNIKQPVTGFDDQYCFTRIDEA